jgi:hypothetical protein
MKAKGEIISTVLSSRDEAVFARPQNIQRSAVDSTATILNEFASLCRSSIERNAEAKRASQRTYAVKSQAD